MSKLDSAEAEGMINTCAAIMAGTVPANKLLWLLTSGESTDLAWLRNPTPASLHDLSTFVRAASEANFYDEYPVSGGHRGAVFENCLRAGLPESLAKDIGWSFRYARNGVAVILPPTHDGTLADRLAKPSFVRERIKNQDGRYVCLQIARSPSEMNADFPFIENCHPLLRAALDHVLLWPGIMFQDRFGKITGRFIGDTDTEEGFSHLCKRTKAFFSGGRPWLTEKLNQQWAKEQIPDTEIWQRLAHIIQVSDLHFGDKKCDQAFNRIIHHVRMQVEQIGKRGDIGVVVSGDILHPNLFNKHSPQSLHLANSFLDQLQGILGKPPFFVPGNHDLAGWGFLPNGRRREMSLSTDRTQQIGQSNVHLVGFDSASNGRFADGCVPAAQLDAAASIIARLHPRPDWLVGIVHHHPVPFQRSPYLQLSQTRKAAEDATEFMRTFTNCNEFLRAVEADDRYVAILHGHKHIPHLGASPGKVPVIGCGSSTGQIRSTMGYPVQSINHISVDTASGHTSCRFYVQHGHGTQLEEATSADFLAVGDRC